MFIPADQAVETANREIRQTQIEGDPLFAPWGAASVGAPVLVSDVLKNPSYWLVPIIIQEHVAGFVRIIGTGEVAAVGVYYRDPRRIENCPSIITRIEAAEALLRAEQTIAPDSGEVTTDPVFVHDGPPGREAWLVEVMREGMAVRWVFVTSGGIYERPAGTTLEESRLI